MIPLYFEKVYIWKIGQGDPAQNSRVTVVSGMAFSSDYCRLT
jgi:hypothetical protein